MNTGTRYNWQRTEQIHEAIIDFIKCNGAATAKRIGDEMVQRGFLLKSGAVYLHLSNLVKAGKLTKANDWPVKFAVEIEYDSEI